MEQTPFTLASLAAAAQMTPRNIRAYQSRGLLPPPSLHGRTARYGPEHLGRLRLVHALRVRGLSLKLISEMVMRGTADAELVRLARDELDGVGEPAALVRVHEDARRDSESEAPGILDRLVEAGVLQRVGDDYLGDAAVLALARQLVLAGVPAGLTCQVAARAGEAAKPVAELVTEATDNHHRSTAAAKGAVPDLQSAQENGIQLAVWAFAESLTRQLRR